MPIKPIPGTEDIAIKPAFQERYSKLTDWQEFRKYSLSFLRKSIRVNTLKTQVDEVKSRLSSDWHLTPIPWCKEGFWVEHNLGRLDIGNTVEHCLGYYYVQEAASMIPPIVLDPQPGDRVLDLCAAPGSKTTQLAQYMGNKGVLIANDITGDRLAALGINLMRMGVANCAVTRMQGQAFRNAEFDRILVDAPCSGTGTIRKSLKTLMLWNPAMVTRLSRIQLQLLNTSWKLLVSGGRLVYSTCSVEPEEDEGVVSNFLQTHDDAEVEEIKLQLKRGTITNFEQTNYDQRTMKCLRLWPQDNDTEGFFVTSFRKK